MVVEGRRNSERRRLEGSTADGSDGRHELGERDEHQEHGDAAKVTTDPWGAHIGFRRALTAAEDSTAARRTATPKGDAMFGQ